jgi:glutaredoxin
MNFPEPKKNTFTIYTKSGCINCNKVKQLLKDKHLLVYIIDCDEFILENKDEFLTFIKSLTNKDHRTFPIVFDSNKFIGGFLETQTYLDNEFLTFEF